MGVGVGFGCKFHKWPDGVVGGCSKWPIPLLPIVGIPIQRQSMHYIRTQEVGNLLNRALDEHA